eukprot:2796192-Amphidinium_carterae.3
MALFGFAHLAHGFASFALGRYVLQFSLAASLRCCLPMDRYMHAINGNGGSPPANGHVDISIASLNINGLMTPGRVHSLFSMPYDAFLLSETHATSKVQALVGHSSQGYTISWGSPTQSLHTGGCAIAIRTAILSGIQTIALEEGHPLFEYYSAGHFHAARVWFRHLRDPVLLVSVYGKVENPRYNVGRFRELRTFVISLGAQSVLLGGDWNTQLQETALRDFLSTGHLHNVHSFYDQDTQPTSDHGRGRRIDHMLVNHRAAQEVAGAGLDWSSSG